MLIVPKAISIQKFGGLVEIQEQIQEQIQELPTLLSLRHDAV